MNEASEQLIQAARDVAWSQVVSNGGPPCFHYDDYEHKFCLRAFSWPGHARRGFHDFVPLDEMLRALQSERTWQPIETAPQKPAARGVRGDQEALLVWRPGLPEGITAFQHLPDAEWYSCETGMPLGWKPTRWQPLPDPPEEKPE